MKDHKHFRFIDRITEVVLDTARQNTCIIIIEAEYRCVKCNAILKRDFYKVLDVPEYIREGRWEVEMEWHDTQE
jgi:hypothetical protein